MACYARNDVKKGSVREEEKGEGGGEGRRGREEGKGRGVRRREEVLLTRQSFTILSTALCAMEMVSSDGRQRHLRSITWMALWSKQSCM